MPGNEQQALARERWALLRRVEDLLELPMVVLAFVWLALLVVELVAGTRPWMVFAGAGIWIIFWIDFLVRLALAPHKWPYIRRNWLTLLALLLPALRIFRIARALQLMRTARAAKTVRLLRLLTSVNRGIGVLGRTLKRRGFGYVLLVTAIVLFAGASGIYAFEQQQQYPDFGTALWWTAMLMMSVGVDVWPQTPYGRIVGFLLALYGFTFFGYVTATLASYFINMDAEEERTRAGSSDESERLRQEVDALRAALRDSRRRDGGPE